MIIQIPLKTLPCPHDRLNPKMLYECLACGRYVSHDKHKGILLCGEMGSNTCDGRSGPWIPQAKWEIAQSYEKGVI
jgi:hypothetical protein